MYNSGGFFVWNVGEDDKVTLFFQLIKQLKKSGIYDNTVILVTTDNGGANWKSNRSNNQSQLLSGSVSALGLGGFGFDPRPSHTIKT